MHTKGISNPHCLIVPGATDFRKHDKVTVAITNNGEGEIEKYMDRMFGTHFMGTHLPHNVAGSETVADTLVS